MCFVNLSLSVFIYLFMYLSNHPAIPSVQRGEISINFLLILPFIGSLTNTKKEISVRVTTSQGEKNIYSFSTGTYVTLMNKQARRVEVNYFLTIKAPSKELISVTGKGDFWPNSMFKGDVKLMVDWIYKVSVNCMENFLLLKSYFFTLYCTESNKLSSRADINQYHEMI